MMLNDEQMAALENAMRNLKGARKRAAVIKWAEDVLLNHGLLENVLKGHMEIPSYTESDGPAFKLTDEGTDAVKKLLRESSVSEEVTR